MIFGEHDLGARAPFPRIDLILCRNVLIYFNPPMQRAALETFGFSLRDDGRLVLGPSETVAALPGPYVEEHARLRIYRRAAGTAAAAARPRTKPHPAAARPRAAARHRDPLDPPGRPGRGRLDRGGRGAAARPRARGRRRRRALLHHPDQHGGPADARDPRPRRSTRTSSTSPSRCRRRRSAPRSTPRSAARRRRPSTRSRRPTSRPTARASSRPSSDRTSGSRAPVEGAVIELTDVSAAERDRRPTARAGAAARAGGRRQPAPARAPTTS